MSSKQIQIRRREKTNTTLPTEVLNDARMVIGSVFDGAAPLSGLTTEQEKTVLPGIIRVGPDNHVEWPRKVRDFWAEMRVIVPSSGTVLEIGLDDDGNPLRIDDWIKFQWIKKHPGVGVNQSDMLNKGCSAYIFDPEENDVSENRKVKHRKISYREFIKIFSGTDVDWKRVDRIVRVLLGVNPDNLSENQKENQLEQIATSDPRRFYEVVTDKDLEVRSEIEDMIEAGVIERIGTHLKFGTDTIGHSTEEGIEYFKSKTNTRAVSTMRSRLETGVGSVLEPGSLAIAD